MFTSERPYYSLALFSRIICTCTFSKKKKMASKRTLDYFRKKYPEYANNWLVSQIAVRTETVNVTAHLVGVTLNYLTQVITSQKLLKRVAVMLEYMPRVKYASINELCIVHCIEC